MIVEITEDDIRNVGAVLSAQMVDKINSIWSGDFGIPEAADPIEILRTLFLLSQDSNSSDSVMADSFAAFLEVESYGLLYKKLLTGKDYSGYLENGSIGEFLA